jgi:hypothetical protein
MLHHRIFDDGVVVVGDDVDSGDDVVVRIFCFF